MSRVSLLDVNVLVALFDSNHIHHDIAHEWFSEEGGIGWATCPLTENGFLRTANTGRKADFLPLPELVVYLAKVRSLEGHHFWLDDTTFANDELFDARAIHGRRQLTDIYLLGLAVTHGGRLVTFDRRIPLAAVTGARAEHLVVLSPAA
jgi:uncharacterized protein